MVPSPASLVGAILRECRRRDFEFEAAWMLAVRSLPRSQPDIMEWRLALAQSKPYWRSAYQGDATTRVVAVLHIDATGLARLTDRVREGASSERSVAS